MFCRYRDTMALPLSGKKPLPDPEAGSTKPLGQHADRRKDTGEIDASCEGESEDPGNRGTE